MTLEIPDNSLVKLPAELALADIPVEAVGLLFMMAAIQCELPEDGVQRIFDRLNGYPDVEKHMKELGDRGIVSAAVNGNKVAIRIDLEPLGL